MRNIILPLLAFIYTSCAWAQNSYQAVVKDKSNNEPLPGTIVQVAGTAIGISADENGFIRLKGIPNGKQLISFRIIGYNEQIDTVVFPRTNSDTAFIFLISNEDEIDEVQISSTRSTRSIKDIPTRVEFIAMEELEEKGNMKPGDIRMVLAESTGIQTQQTSATSANTSIRIQGLDGRYTQLLKDGFPLYSGASGGLGLLQIPPLDLKQVEVIKGSASTLYGGGAIAGLVNLISKTPTNEKELRFLANITSAKGIDFSGFYSRRIKKTGTTIYIAHNRNKAYDPANIDLTAIPKFERLTFNPKIFFYPTEKTTLSLGVNTTFENRIGGDMHYIQHQTDSLHSYFESNTTIRVSTQFNLEYQIHKNQRLTFKNSLSYFHRILKTPGYEFDGLQNSSFSELNYTTFSDKSEWIAGINLWTDKFIEHVFDSSSARNSHQITSGLFIQNNLKAKSWLSLETGFRVDYIKNYGFAFLPRLAALIKLSDQLTSRIGGGLGYKTPSIFTEESERIHYKNVLGINQNNSRLERSYGVNWDFNFRNSFADHKISFSFNVLFFYTYLNHQLILNALPNNTYQFVNMSGNAISDGAELNLKLGYQRLKLYSGFTYTHSRIYQNGLHSDNILTPKNRFNNVLIYEIEAVVSGKNN